METKKDLQATIGGAYFRNQISRLIPDPKGVERFVRVALNAFLRWPDLRGCTEQSLVKTFLTLAEQRLEPNGVDAAVIVRRNRDGVSEASAMVMYRGLLKVARRIDGIGKIKAETIHANDKFDWSMGEVIAHRILDLNNRGDIIGAYAQATVGDDTYCEVMTRKELEACRAKSDSWRRAPNQGAWAEFEGEMSKKTVLRRLCKFLPTGENAPTMNDEGVIEHTVTAGPPEAPTEAIAAPPVEDVIDTAPASEQAGSSPQQALAMMAIELGFDLAWFHDYARVRRMIEHPVDDWSQIPAEAAQLAVDNRKAIAKAIKEGRR